MSSYTLYTDAGNFRAFKILIAAEYNQINIKIPDFKVGTDNTTPAFLSKSPQGKIPVLENASGNVITESNAISRYIAKLRLDSELLGATLFESAQVDSWIEFCTNNIELPATLWFYPVLGFIPFNEVTSNKAKEDLLKALKVIDAHLLDKTYLVGHKITLADITVISALIYPFKFVADPKYRSAIPNVIRWFTTCVNQPAFISVVGKVDLAASETKSASASQISPQKDSKEKANKEKAPKAPKPQKEAPKPKPKPAKEEDDEEEEERVVEKKEDHPFKILDQTAKSSFVMDTWKKTYSNAADYAVAMDTFWSTFDPNGWSIFRGDYNYNEESKVLFMTSNLIGGFIQRTEEIRKWLFGTMTIRGEEGKLMKITCYYLIRGDSIEPLIKCNDDAACYTWTKMAIPASPEDKAKLFEYWCSEVSLEGEPLLDSRCYK